MSSRSNSEITVISWRQIPAQVVAKRGRDTAKKELSPRFQVAIDRAAMYAGLFGTDEYLSEWKRVSRPCGEDLATEAAEEAARLEAEFTPELLNEVAGNGGTR